MKQILIPLVIMTYVRLDVLMGFESEIFGLKMTKRVSQTDPIIKNLFWSLFTDLGNDATNDHMPECAMNDGYKINQIPQIAKEIQNTLSNLVQLIKKRGLNLFMIEEIQELMIERASHLKPLYTCHKSYKENTKRKEITLDHYKEIVQCIIKGYKKLYDFKDVKDWTNYDALNKRWNYLPDSDISQLQKKISSFKLNNQSINGSTNDDISYYNNRIKQILKFKSDIYSKKIKKIVDGIEEIIYTFDKKKIKVLSKSLEEYKDPFDPDFNFVEDFFYQKPEAI